ncbi:MAG: TIGR04190 family B12-binding domain/radical SAM domain protein [Thermodesulfovibrionales bacterium]|jgi:B12-binding domain/radical SAM domain protein
MANPDLILLHPPSIFRFRDLPIFRGPISDVVPSSSIFELYSIGFLTISEYLHRHGLNVMIVNVALKMLKDRSFDTEAFIAKLNPLAFGIDLHWLPHVDGSLSLAEIIKKHHPHKPIIFGGLSSTYYYDEIMRDYPFVDFVLRGDSTEEPLRMLIHALQSGAGYESIPNLVWRDRDGSIQVNEFSHCPESLDAVHFDYRHLLKMAIKYRDPSGYIPFRYWLTYPVSAVFQCRGCTGSCASCAGSYASFKSVCAREKPCFRSPELLAEDMKRISEFSEGPIMVIGDLLQVGESYGKRFLDSLKQFHIKNEISIEFFTPPPDDFIKRIADSVRMFNVEISPESHDLKVRRAFGKQHYVNQTFERMIQALLESGSKRIDVFFLIGLPYQDSASVMDTVRYCEDLMKNYDTTGRLLPMISPLAPFIDPGSSIFENPEKFGYRLFYKTLREHREAMLMSSWKYMLNYETRWMTRDEIVRTTYEAALMLVDIRERYKLLGKEKALTIKRDIKRAQDLIERIDHAVVIDDALKAEIMSLNDVDTLCDKHELDWPLKGWIENVLKIFRLLLH